MKLLIFINYCIAIIVLFEYLQRDQDYIDFGFIGLFVIFVEFFAIVVFLMLKEKNLYQIILFSISLLIIFYTLLK